MALKAKLSVFGLWQWNHDIFSGMALPESVDGDILTSVILENLAGLEVLYTDPEYMQASIHVWSSAMLPNWNKIQEALTAEYNPIWNKDGTIRETRNYGAQEESRTYGTITETTNLGARSAENTHQVAGYNSDTLNNAEKDTATSQAAQDTSSRAAHTDTAGREGYTDSFTRIEQGNIGVTESSSMVQHEVELRQKFNIYDIITADFKKHYCLMVY